MYGISKTQKRLRKIIRNFFQPTYAKNFGVWLPVKHNLISRSIAREIYLGEYEKSEATIVSKRLEEEDIVMEVGSGIGFLSAYCAKKIGSDRVFTYDANPALQPVIDGTYSRNHVKPHFKNVMLGVGHKKRTFFVENEFWASSGNYGSNSSREILVDQIDLNSEIDIIQPTFLIVDIEGGEIDFFSIANLSSVKKICVETHPHLVTNKLVSEMIGKLLKQGFCLDLGAAQKYVIYFYKP